MGVTELLNIARLEANEAPCRWIAEEAIFGAPLKQGRKRKENE